MKKKILCLIMIFAVIFILPVNVSAFEYNKNDIIIDFIPGDLDGNGSINSSDARICLRAAANLETLSEKQTKSADIDASGKINSSDARAILRSSAKLETLHFLINADKGQNIVIGPMQIWGIKCELTEQNDKVTVSKTTEKDDPEVAGVPVISYFTINASESGSYKLTLTSSQPWNDSVTTHYNVILNVK